MPRHERGGEAAQRLRDDDQTGPIACHGVGVLGQAGRVVVKGKIRSYRVMASLAQFGRHQMPVPADIAGAVDEDKCSHPASFYCSDPDRDRYLLVRPGAFRGARFRFHDQARRRYRRSLVRRRAGSWRWRCVAARVGRPGRQPEMR
jgi:hypothetical protein